MKILGIVCSPRKGGNTTILMEEALSRAQQLGAETELLHIAGKNIAPCDGCGACWVTKECKIKDDMQEIYSKLKGADAIIFGSPVYFWNVTAQAKVIMDRTHVFMSERALRQKVGGVIVVGHRAGATQVFGSLLNYFHLHRMFSAGGAIAYADQKGDVRKDSQGMADAKALGSAIVRVVQISSGNRLERPTGEKLPTTSPDA